MKTRLTILAFLAISLAACAPAVVSPTATPIPTATDTPVPPTPTPPPIVATPLPAQSFTPIMTPDATQVARWKEYQTALARCVLAQSGCDYSHPEYALCEWDILGRSGQEVYIWAMCLYTTQAEKPLVVYLQPDGSIMEVKFGGYNGPYYNLKLFPVDVQKKIDLYRGGPGYSSRVKELGMHLAWRLKQADWWDTLPLIVLSATATP
jgi:hypothetical protein